MLSLQYILGCSSVLCHGLRDYHFINNTAIESYPCSLRLPLLHYSLKKLKQIDLHILLNYILAQLFEWKVALKY